MVLLLSPFYRGRNRFGEVKILAQQVENETQVLLIPRVQALDLNRVSHGRDFFFFFFFFLQVLEGKATQEEAVLIS